MSLSFPLISNFSGGQASPRLDGRVDMNKYFNSCRTLQNMIIHPHGGASRRFGTVFVTEIKNSANIARLIPFQFSATQAYILEFGQQYIRFYMNNGQIQSGTAACEIASSYTTSMLSSLKYVETSDTMRLVHNLVYPQILIRFAHDSWTIGNIPFYYNTGAGTPPVWGSSNYPAAIGIYEQRMMYGATVASPTSMWISVTGAYDDLSVTPIQDDMGMELTLDSKEVNTIRWMTDGRYMNVGTVGAEWIVYSGSDNDTMTPTKRKARRVTNYGSADIQGSFIGNAILFVQSFGRKVLELTYQYVQDNYDAPDLTLWAENITEAGSIKEWAFQKQPNAILWCVTTDGRLIGLTYNRGQEVVGWHVHLTDGTFESVACIPGTDHDQVWFIVNRTINGQTKRYIEYLAPDFIENQNACWFVDCGLTYSGTSTSNLSGISHLEGKLVSVLADGAVSTRTTVVAGAVNIPYAAASVTLGLPFNSILEPMDLEVPSNMGTSQGRLKRIVRLAIRFYRTLGCKISDGSGLIDEIPFRTPSDLMGHPPALFTGDKEVPFPGGWDRHGYIRIESDAPLPMTVLSIMPEVDKE